MLAISGPLLHPGYPRASESLLFWDRGYHPPGPAPAADGDSSHPRRQNDVIFNVVKLEYQARVHRRLGPALVAEGQSRGSTLPLRG